MWSCTLIACVNGSVLDGALHCIWSAKPWPPPTKHSALIKMISCQYQRSAHLDLTHVYRTEEKICQSFLRLTPFIQILILTITLEGCCFGRFMNTQPEEICGKSQQIVETVRKALTNGLTFTAGGFWFTAYFSLYFGDGCIFYCIFSTKSMYVSLRLDTNLFCDSNWLCFMRYEV